ncbi:MAG: 30S ribosomal protein S19e [Nanobdellota archaeon]
MIYDVSQQELVLHLAEQLKKEIEMPNWAYFVKTGSHRETLPKHPDWWFIRAASILRICYKNGPIGVSKLRTRYGGRMNRGFRPDMFRRSSGKIIRTILQQLESKELIKQDTVGIYKGRVVTSKGLSLLASSSKAVAKNNKGGN